MGYGMTTSGRHARPFQQSDREHPAARADVGRWPASISATAVPNESISPFVAARSRQPSCLLLRRTVKDTLSIRWANSLTEWNDFYTLCRVFFTYAHQSILPREKHLDLLSSAARDLRPVLLSVRPD